MKTNPVVWFEIYVNDMQRAITFYESVFMFKMKPMPASECPGGEPMEMTMFPGAEGEDCGTTPGASGALVKTESRQPGTTGSLLYFSCDDCAVEAKRAAQAGGNIALEKTSLGEYGYMSIIRDTEGNDIGLHSLK